MKRRSFLQSILAAGVAPAFVGSSVLMPVRRLILPVPVRELREYDIERDSMVYRVDTTVLLDGVVQQLHVTTVGRLPSDDVRRAAVRYLSMCARELGGVCMAPRIPAGANALPPLPELLLGRYV